MLGQASNVLPKAKQSSCRKQPKMFFLNTIYMSESALTCYGRGRWGREKSRLHVNK